MKDSKILMSVSVLLVLFIASCQGGGPSSTNINEDYHKGTQGIVMTFVNNAPPARVYDGDTLDIDIQLENKGAYPESGRVVGKLEITGADTNAIRGTWDGGNTLPVDLEGRSQNNPPGGIAIMSYRDTDGVHVPFDADYYEPNLIVHSCYKYKTVADPIVCIDADPYEVVQEKKVCQIGNVGVSGGQGAPIAVTRVE